VIPCRHAGFKFPIVQVDKEEKESPGNTGLF
jgi:hypothetical protein